MKNLFFTLLISCIFSSLNAQTTKVIERPLHGLRNSDTFEIDKIVLSDTATLLYVDAFYRPKNWIRVDKDTYIIANGKKLPIKGSEGIKIDDKHWMPESGEDSFILIFPPIALDTKSIDFIESDCDDCFKIWDIDLTGEQKQYTSQLPIEANNIKIDRNKTLSDPEYKYGRTTVIVHPIGYREGYALDGAKLIYNNFLTMGQESIEPEIQNDGSLKFEFDQYSTTTAILVLGNIYPNIVLSPGETTEVYWDMAATALKNAKYHKLPEHTSDLYFKGVYADLNHELASYDNQKISEETQQWYNSLSGNSIHTKPTSEYVANNIQGYQNVIRKIESTDEYSPQLKEYLTIQQKERLLSYLYSMDRFYTGSYRRENNIPNTQRKIDFEAPVLNDELLLTTRDLGLNDDKWAYIFGFYSLPNMMKEVSSIETIHQLAGSQNGLLQDLYYSSSILPKTVKLTPLTEEEKNILNQRSKPIFAEAADILTRKTQEQYDNAMAQGGFTICETPDVEDEKVFDAIIAQYKGKPVFVDFWATWCGPCLNAMKTMKPLKPLMAEHDVEIIYITNPSSPQVRWTTMLPDIGGKHYYLTNEQWQIIGERFNIQGIPFYLIMDKEGEKAYQALGFPGVEKMQEELEKVW